jgi:hypothetical protein
MASFRYPYLHLELSTCQYLSKKGCRDCGPERNTGQACRFATGTEVFENRISVIHVLCDIESIRPMCAVIIFVAGFPEEEPDGAIGLWGLGRKFFEECDETGVERILK